MKDSTQRKFGAILSYVSILANTLVQLLYTPILIRFLGQSEYGLYSLISALIGYLTVLDLGFGNALIVYSNKYRASNQKEKEEKLFGMFKIIFYIIGFVIAILGFILFLNTETLFGNTMTDNELNKTKIMMLILIFNLIITFFFNIYQSIISAYEKFTFQKIMSILVTILRPVIMIPFLFMGYKSITLCVVLTSVNLLFCLSNYFYCKNKLKIKVKFSGFDVNIFKVIFSYSFFIFIGVIVEKVNWSLDQFILGACVGTLEIAIYSVAIQFVSLFRNISSAWGGILLPKLSKMVANNCDDTSLNNEFIKYGRIQWFIIFLFMSGLIIFGYEFIKIWAGIEYEKAYYIVLILVIPEAFVLTESLGVYIMQAKNMHKTKAIVSLITAIANVIISIPLALRLGAVGSAIGTALSLVVCNLIVMNIYYQNVVKIDILKFWKNIIINSVPIICLFILVFILSKYIVVFNSLLLIMLGAITYSIISIPSGGAPIPTLTLAKLFVFK